MEKYRILVINPGSTSTKVAVFDSETSDLKQIMEQTLRHSSAELSEYKNILEQFGFRKKLIIDLLHKHNIELCTIDAVIGRGGLVKPISSGVYEITESLRHDLTNPPQGEHASNLGGLLADEIAADISATCTSEQSKTCKAYIADPVVVDEMSDVAKISGHPLFHRASIFHALNQKAIARTYAKNIGKKYEDLNLIVAHMGGGVSVGAHLRGRIVDVNNALDGDGPFSPERSGTLPAGALAELCFSGKYTLQEVKKMINGKGGMVAHLGTNNTIEILDAAKSGDAKSQLIVDAFCYNVSKEIGQMAAVLCGKVDAIILTGGIAYSSTVCDKIKTHTEFIAPVIVLAGEDEMLALAQNAVSVLKGEFKVSYY